MFVNNALTSKPPIAKELFCSTISFVKQKKASLTVNSLDGKEFFLGTKTFEILYDGVPIAERAGLKVLFMYVTKTL